MASTCILCLKGTQMAGGYSNRVRATKFTPTGKKRRYPNLQWAQVPGASRIKICTRCIKAKKHIELAA